MKKVMALIGFATLCMTGVAFSAEDTFVPLGATWKYLDTGSDQGMAWVAPSFDDSGWSSGPAQLGYGDGDESTVVSFGGVNNNKFITTYFRHTFTVPNPGIYAVLRLRVRRDDGVVVYLNGNEVFRSNMGTGPVTFDTRAQNAGDDGSTLILGNVNPANLVGGDNVLAAEIHQDSPGSSDISFDLELIGSTDNTAPFVSLLSPLNNASFTAPAEIQLRASASDPDGNLSRVEFYSGTTKLGEATTDPYTILLSSVDVGNYAFYAVATDALNLRTTSTVVSVTVASSSPPVLASQVPAPGNVTSLTQLTVTFSEPVTGVDAADLLINGLPAASVTGADAVYTFTFAQPADGVVLVAWDPRHGIVDFENPPQAFDHYGGGAAWQYSLADALAPVAVQVLPAPGATVRSLDRITIQFSEPVTGIDAADLRINNLPATSVSGHGAGPYEFTFAQPVNGTVNVAWAAGADIRDYSGARNLFAGGAWSYSMNSAAVFEERIVINEIMYHPVSERDDEEWIELHNRGTNTVNLTGWQLSRGADFIFPNVSLAAGGYLVVAANVAAFNAANPGVANVVGGWAGRLSNSGEDVEIEDANGERVDIVNYAEQGEFALRRRWPTDTRGWEWFAEHDGLGSSLELRNPGLDNDQGQNWSSSSVLNGTPGGANSVASANIPPMVLDVAHFPIVPRSTNAISVTARIVDELTTGLSVNLRWRDASTLSPDVFNSVTMFDDGAHGDGAAGDRVYGASVAPQSDRTVVEYYVEATDTAANMRTWPAAAEEIGGSFEQVANALIQVDDETYAGSQPVYRLIMTESDRVAFAAQTRNSDAQRNVTFVAIEAGSTEFRHNCGLRYRGAGSRGRNPPTMRLNIVGDKKWNNKSSINLNSQYTHAQVIGGQVSILSGLPSEYARAVQLRVNGSNPAGSGSPQFGTYAAVEATNGELVGEHLPDDGDGNVYRASTGNWSATLNYLGTDPAAYQQAGYSKNSNATENDWSDLINLTFALDPATTSDADYVAAVRRNVNVELWLRYFAMCSLMAYTESSLANGRGDDYGLYRGLVDQRFIILPHDFDTIFNEGDTRANVNESIYLAATRMATINRFLLHPEFEPLYHAEFRRLLSTTFTTNNLYSLIDQFLGDWVTPQTMQAMKTFIAARNASVLAQLPAVPVVVRATVSGEPSSPTYQSTASLTVGGAGITHYRYRLNGGAFGAETLVGTPIELTGLADGTYTLFVIGRDSAGTWQSENDPTLSRTWTVISNLRGVILNEVLARNVGAVNINGTYPDMVELYNPRAATVDLSGLRLTDDLNTPDRFVFPAGTTIAAGGYLVLLANNPDGSSGIHLGFSLDQNGESLYLLDSTANGGALLDSVQFGLQLADLSVGRLANGEWTLCTPTLGIANLASATGSQSTLRINEWLASGVAPLVDDFVELYNPDPLPVAIGGLFLTDLPVGQPFQHQITPLSFLPGFAYKTFIADNSPELGTDHLSFQLSSSIGEIGLIRPDGSVIDSVIYGLQRDGVSQGRAPNGGAPIVFLTPPTPGAPNPVPPAPAQPVVVNLLPLNDTFLWRYEESGTDLGTSWSATGFNDLSWPSGPALLAAETGFTPEPIRTSLSVASGKITFYFRAHFNLPANMNVSALQVTYAIDDGAVFHLNGVEAARFNMPNGPISFFTQASGSHEASALETLNLNLASLVPGDNVLAVEVHQQGINSSDVVFGLKLDAIILTNSPTAAGVVINEVFANNQSVTNSDGTVSDWVELRNPSNAAVDLAGMSLTDRTEDSRRWVFPSGSVVPAGGYLVVRFNPNLPVTTNSSATLNTGFGLKAGGDAVYFFNRPETGGELLDGITFGLQAADFTIGRIPAGSTNWGLSLPTFASANLAAAVGDPTRLRVNEWMADPNSGEDWFEIYNPNQQPVALGGLSLTDDLNDRDKNPLPPLSFIATGLRGFQRFEADNNPAAGADHVSFRLSADGESLGIVSAVGELIDSVTFGPQTEGVSEGRLPDGSPSIVSFPDTATPGDANFLTLPNIVINEVLTHSDLPLEDAIELHNSGTADVDVSGWYLSDSPNNPRKFVIPANTVIPAGGYVVFYEEQFNLFNPNTPFSLSSANGDEVHLSQISALGVLTGYRAVTRFGAAAPGVSFGRHLTSMGADFTAMSQRTFGEDTPVSVEEFRAGTGALNSSPLVGPIVINEIMYHPPGIIVDGVTNDNEIHEFIELHNFSAGDVPLFDVSHATNTWRLRDAVDFEFPLNVTLPAGGYLLVVSFDPATNAAALATFRGRFGIDAAVPIYGPWRGRLANSSENIELYKPDAPQDPGTPDEGFVPYVEVDKVRYSDALPWPSLADGGPGGSEFSLQRRVASEYGNDPVNWIAGPPTAGAATGPAALTPPTISNFTVSQVVQAGASSTLTVTASGGGTLTYEWRLNGSVIAGATSASLTLNDFQAVNAGVYSVLVANGAGAASASTRVDLRSAPTILRQPFDQVAVADGDALFTVLAAGTPPVSYLWSKEDVIVSGANGPTLILQNVQLADAVNYRVVITNAYGAVTSSVATLSIVSPPVIATQPRGTNVLVGQSASFSVEVLGSAPLHYQWRFNGANIVGATSPTLVLSNLQVANSGSYSVRVTNVIGSVISADAVLEVIAPPSASVVATDASASEPGLDSGLFTFTRSRVTAEPQQIFFTVTGGAIAESDYAGLSSPVTIPAGADSVTLSINVLDDSLLEGDETVVVTVVNGPDYVAGVPSSAAVTIADNDNQAPVVTVTEPTDGSVVTFPSSITISASAIDADGSITKVEFYANGTNKLGEDALSPFTITWSNAPAGTHVVTAVATDNFGSTGVSAPVPVIVNNRPSVNLTSPSGGAILPPGSSITVSASATDSDGTVTQVEFYQGTSLLGVDSSSPYSIVWDTVPEGVYLLTARATDNRGTVNTSAVVTITVGIPAPTFGDMFASRGVVNGFTNTIRGTNITFTREAGEPRHASRNGNHSGWLNWTAPASGLCRMDTFGSDFDTLLAVYTGSSVSNLTVVAANDDANGDTIQSSIAFYVTNGFTYQIVVDGLGTNGTILLGNAGTMVLNFALPNLNPVFLTQPQSQVVTQGNNVTFSATTAGPGPQTYQWRFNNTSLTGQTNLTLARNNVGANNAGNYVIVASNASGSTTSAVAVLTVRTSPIINTQPADITVSRDSDAVFSVRASGFTPLAFQWRYKGSDIPGATSSNLVLRNVQGRDEGAYSVAISNPIGTTTSRDAMLTVDDGLVTSTYETLLDVTNSWRYEASGQNLSNAWRFPDYDDSGWSSGVAMFGYETNPAQYPLPFLTPFSATSPGGTPIQTYYLRTTFHIADPASVGGLLLGAFVDDGAVWYINGREATRLRIPAQIPVDGVTYNVVANNLSNEGTSSTLDVPATNLVAGENLLSVELHQANLPSSDVVFAMAMASFNFVTNGPVLSVPEPQTGGGLRVTLTGISGRNYALDVSTNFESWVPVVTWTNFTGSAEYLDPVVPAPGTRFYRGRVVR